MKKKTLDMLIKKAANKNNSKFDSLLDTLRKSGKPSTTGLVAGAGLGSLLAAAGALSRDGEHPSNVGILSNPLLLGALGATGGYLAGNAFDRMPTATDKSYPKTPWLNRGLAAGGIDTFGSLLAKDDIAKTLDGAKKEYEARYKDIDVRAKQRKDKLGRIIVDFSKGKTSPKKREAFLAARKRYANALRGAGQLDEAVFHGVKAPPSKLGWKVLEKLRFSPYSPLRWMKAVNPAKGLGVFKNIGAVATKNPKTTALAALALLAGGGKAVYDKVSDK